MRRVRFVAACVALLAPVGLGAMALTNSAIAAPASKPVKPAVKPAGQAAVAPHVTTPTGNVYVSNLTMRTISQYSASTSGHLTPLSPPTLSVESLTPGEMGLNPSGHNLYVAEFDSADGTKDVIAQYRVAADGTLSVMSPPSVATAAGPVEVVSSLDGQFLYVNNAGAGLISQYRIGPDGALTAQSPPNVAPASGDAGEIAISPNGKFLYAGGSQISQFSVGEDGRLTPLVPATVGSDGDDIKITPDNKFLYSSAGDGVDQYSISPTGQLTALTPAHTGSVRTLELAMTANGKFIYATGLSASFDSVIAQFSIGADGHLSELAPPTVPTGSVALEAVISPDDRFYYVGNASLSGDATVTDTVSQFAIGSGGTLTALSPATVPTGAGAGALAATLPPPAVAQSAQIPTTVRYNGAVAASVGSIARLSARLTSTESAMPLASMPLRLTFNARESCTAVSGPNGVAACDVATIEPAGTYPVKVSFAGTELYLPSTTAAKFNLSLLTARSSTSEPPAPATTTTTVAPVPPTTTPPLLAVSPVPSAEPTLPTTGGSNRGELESLAILLLALLVWIVRQQASPQTNRPASRR